MRIKSDFVTKANVEIITSPSVKELVSNLKEGDLVTITVHADWCASISTTPCDCGAKA